MKSPPYFCACLAALFLSSGCAAQYAPQTTVVSYYPDCYYPLDTLRQSTKSYNKSVVSGVVAGSLIGAILGILITGKAEGAAVGAVAGAGVGAATGYDSAEKDRNMQLASFLSELDGDISGLDNVNAAGRLSLQCYDKSFKSAISDFKAKRMSRAELDARYAEIKSGSAEALTLMNKQADAARDKDDNYQAALYEEAQMAALPVPKPQSTASRKPPKPTRPKQVTSQREGLQDMADKAQAYTSTRAELESDISKGNSLQQSWEKDLEAIRS